MGEEKSNSDKAKRQIKKIFKDNSKDEDNIISEDESTAQPVADTTDTTNCFDIKSLADKAVNINNLKYEVDRLQLDFKARAYFENDVRPLIDTLYTLSYASTNYSTAAKNLASINFGRSSKIKDALDLTEEVNEISEDLIQVLRCKVDNMLKLSKYDCK